MPATGDCKLPQPSAEDYCRYGKAILKMNATRYASAVSRYQRVLVLVKPALFAKLATKNESGLLHSELKGTYVLCDQTLQSYFGSGDVKAASMLRASLPPQLELTTVPEGYLVAARGFGRGSLLTCGDVESNPGPVFRWLQNKLPVIYRKAADTSFVQGGLAKTGSELFAKAAEKNEAIAKPLAEIASKIGSESLHKYAKNYGDLASRQGRMSKALESTSTKAFTRARQFNGLWRQAHHVRMAAVGSTKKKAIVGLGVLMTGVTLCQEDQPQNPGQQPQNPGAQPQRQGPPPQARTAPQPGVFDASADPSASNCAAGLTEAVATAKAMAAFAARENTPAVDTVVSTAVAILCAAAHNPTTSASYWGNVYMHAFKYTNLHLLQDYQLCELKNGKGDVYGYECPISSKGLEYADMVAAFCRYVEASRQVYCIAMELGDWSNGNLAEYDLSGITCNSVRDTVVQSLHRLQVNPIFLAERLSDLYTELSEYLPEDDWTKERESIVECYHNDSLCDPAICQFTSLCNVFTSTSCYKDNAEIHRVVQCVKRAEKLAPLRGTVVDPGLTAPGGSVGNVPGIGGLLGPPPSRAISFVEALTGGSRVPLSRMDVETNSPTPERSSDSGPGPSGVDRSVAAACVVHPPDGRHKEDASRPCGGVAEKGKAKHAGGGKAALNGGSSDASNGAVPKRDPVAASPTVQVSGPVVGDKPAKIGLAQPVGVGNGAKSARKVTPTVGGEARGVRPGSTPSKGKREDNATRVDDRGMRRIKQENADPEVSATVLEPVDARGLRTQSAQSGKGKSARSGAASDKRSVQPPRIADPDCWFAIDTVEVDNLPGGCRVRISKEQKEAIFNGTARICIAWLHVQGPDGESVCEDGETSNPGPEQGSTDDTVEGDSVPPPVLTNDQAAGARPDERSGPRDKRPNGRKGKKPRRESRTSPKNMASLQQPRERIIRPESVGHACSSGSSQASAEPVRTTRNVPAAPRNDARATPERVLYEQEYQVPRKWRNHEWRYDDRTGELHCSSCYRYVFSGRYKKNCYYERKTHARRLGGTAIKYGNPRSGPSQEVARDTSPSSGRSVNSIVAEHPRRWGRPRDNRRAEPQMDYRRGATYVVENSRTFVARGRDNEQLRGDRVLSAQTMGGSESHHHGSQPVQSNAQVMHGYGEVHREAPFVPPYGMDSQGYPAQGYPYAWPVLPKQRQIAEQGETYRSFQSGIPAYQQFSPLPYAVPGGGYAPPQGAESRRNGSSAVLENVGHFPNGTV